MNKLSLKLPGFGDKEIAINEQGKDSTFTSGSTDLATFVGNILNLVFVIIGVYLLYQLVLGAIRYVTAGDSKENVAKARGRITWAIVGFMVVIAAFAVSQYVKQVLPINQNKLTPVTNPGVTK